MHNIEDAFEHIPSNVQNLIHCARIQDVVMRSLMSLERAESDKFLSCFDCNAEIQTKEFGWVSPIIFLERLAVPLFRYEVIEHNPVSIVVDQHGNLASCNTQCISHFGPSGHLRQGSWGSESAVYRDKLNRVAGEWLITRRQVTVQWTEGTEDA